VAGDWDGDGLTTVGVVDPATMTWYLRNSNSAGAPDFTPFPYGAPGWRPVAGDWNGGGATHVGVVDPGGNWYLRNSNSAGAPDVGPFPYGLGGWTPLAGHWQGAALPLRAAGGVPTPDRAAPPLTDAQLQGVVSAALARLGGAGVPPALVRQLASARYEVGPVSGGDLGLAYPGDQRAVFSADAAGSGWFVDPTPLADEEFRPGAPGAPRTAQTESAAAGRVDLLTVVLHEMGHLAGLPDRDGAGDGDDVMADALPPGVRRVDALDRVFAATGG
jgi:hypothetical protein